MTNKIKTTLATATALAASATPALAIDNPLSGAGITDIPSLIGAIFNAVLAIVGALAFLLLVLGGVQYMSSGGDKIAVEQARGRITAAIVGLVIVLGAYLVINFIGSALTGQPFL